MEKPILRHAKSVEGMLGCIDRCIFNGRIRNLEYPEGVERWLHRNEILKRDLGDFARVWWKRIKEGAKKAAEEGGRAFFSVSSDLRKEDRVRAIVEESGITSGLACVLTATEPIRSYRLLYGNFKQNLHLAKATRRGLVVYFYFLHQQLGLMHARIQAWLPFTIQIHVNGHSWLARKLQEQGLPFEQRDNCFAKIGDIKAAARIAEEFPALDWVSLLDPIARGVNPLLNGVLAQERYEWYVDQCEYSTDIIFADPAELESFSREAIERGCLYLGAEDVMRFLGRRLNPQYQGEVLTQVVKRWPGARIRHVAGSNCIKLYSKNGCALRLETVINWPYDFRVTRSTLRNGTTTVRRAPLVKSIDCFPLFQEVGRDCNERYLQAIEDVSPPGPAHAALLQLQDRLPGARNRRPLNPAATGDVALFKSALAGENHLHGFRNADIRARLFASPVAIDELRKQRRRVSRLLGLLRNRGLIDLIPRTRRWRVTEQGLRSMSAAIRCYEKDFPEAFSTAA